ncbi:MAG TPA: nitroreductase family protein [Nitrososphaeraceae archaeon]
MSFPSDVFSRMFTDKSTQLMYPKEEVPSHDVEDIVQTNIFNVMLNRRSQRKFENKVIEEWKLEMIFAAADTAPTAGGFQGFEIYHIRNEGTKKKLVEAANNQPYVNAPVVMVYCMNPNRVKLNFPPETIRKFSQQDATLAAAYSQLAAHALGLSSIWIGMLDEKKIMEILGTDLLPSSILCLGYPVKMLVPKPKRNLKDLIHEI